MSGNTTGKGLPGALSAKSMSSIELTVISVETRHLLRRQSDRVFDAFCSTLRIWPYQTYLNVLRGQLCYLDAIFCTDGKPAFVVVMHHLML